jgi:transposase
VAGLDETVGDDVPRLKQQGETGTFQKVTMTSADMNDTPAGNEAGGPRAGQPRRRTFSTAYKLAMVREYDSATRPGEKGAILRREGLYDSHITDWRKARGAGRLGAEHARNPVPAQALRQPGKTASESENERLKKKIARLESKIEQQDAALTIVKKAHALLEMLSESADSRNPSAR